MKNPTATAAMTIGPRKRIFYCRLRIAGEWWGPGSYSNYVAGFAACTMLWVAGELVGLAPRR
jgi:hypothetical protein